jgi:F-type H+-transporting ATPase subunit gamma
MTTLEGMRRRINSTEDLQSVVKTMKALAVVSIRQYEQAVAALAEYNQTIELGLQVLLRDRPGAVQTGTATSSTHLGALVFGSDQGMVGQFNEQIVRHTRDVLNGLQVPLADRRIMAVGERVAVQLEDTHAAPEATFPVPSSVAGITPLVQELLVRIDTWRSKNELNRLILFYNAARSGAGYEPTHLRLLPVDAAWLRELEQRPWESRRLPTYTMVWEDLLAALIRQHLFVAIYRACAESLASEHASRLAAMQGAESNIEERLEELTRAFHHQRQTAITEELLDIVAGVTALQEEEA